MTSLSYNKAELWYFNSAVTLQSVPPIYGNSKFCANFKVPNNVATTFVNIVNKLQKLGDLQPLYALKRKPNCQNVKKKVSVWYFSEN